MPTVKIGKTHQSRKDLFQRGLRQGFLTVDEIEEAMPPDAITAAERWLLYYSLRAAEIELRNADGSPALGPQLSNEELVRLASRAEKRRQEEEAEQALEGVESYESLH